MKELVRERLFQIFSFDRGGGDLFFCRLSLDMENFPTMPLSDSIFSLGPTWLLSQNSRALVFSGNVVGFRRF
jgi:hypothetical protein